MNVSINFFYSAINLFNHSSNLFTIGFFKFRILKKIIIMRSFFLKYYPIILAFLSFLYSVSLWFTGNKLEGIFVGIWVPSILAFSIAIKQISKK
tara:strand:+ start:100 stop:381 length:282 start_codon:yes stop_codon:yes gene_type:complete